MPRRLGPGPSPENHPISLPELIETVGTIVSARERAGAREFVIEAPALAGEVKDGDSITVDGACTEPAWTQASPVPFPLPNPTNNDGDCRLLWSSGVPDQVYGCCEFTDADLYAQVDVHDGPVWEDDSIEYFLKGNSDSTFDATTTKTTINLLATVLDVDMDPPWDSTYDANAVVFANLDGTLTAGDTDTGFVIEWRANAGFAVVPGQLGRCSFMLNDWDDQGGSPSLTQWLAFGEDVNEPLDWGICRFSCEPPG